MRLCGLPFWLTPAPDVILSTLKPQLKNVTAADVANSLYYVHLDLPSDVLLVSPALARDDDSRRLSGESARGPIARKPLPPNATVTTSAETADSGPVTPANPARPRGPNPLDASSSSPHISTNRPTPSEPPHGGPKLAPHPPSNYPRPSSSSINRKPLGPRPMEAPPVPGKDRPPRPTSQHFDAKSNEPRPSQQPLFPASGETIQAPPLAYDSLASRSPSPRKSRGRRPSSIPFSLTLIRRDPASGHQWNVGKISSLQTNGPSLQAADPDQAPQHIDGPNGQPKIDIRLENSGYAKFRGMPTAASIDALRSTSSTSLPPQRGAPRNSTGDDTVPAGPGPRVEWNVDGGFTRQVVMSYSKTWASNLKHAFRKRERPHSVQVASADYISPLATDLIPPPPPPREPHGAPRHARHESVASTTSVESFASRNGAADSTPASATPPSPPLPLITEPGAGLKAKGYVFTSPWEGRCEFRTGNAGRSLKCRHVLHPGGSGSGFGAMGPAALMQGHHDGPSGARLASELRFNLPSSDLFAAVSTPPRGDGEGAHSRHLHGRLSRLLKLDPRHWDGSDGEDDAPAALDLSLGREKAGGGNRGARAKLGKLIIHDEGLKMLDLVVAANVGVWWVAWEKAF